MKVACAFDHAGFPLKQLVIDVVGDLGHEPVDLGTHSTDPVDYPDIARAGGRGGALRPRRARRGGLRVGRRRGGGGLQGAGHPRRLHPRHLLRRTSASSTTTSTCCAWARA